MVLGFFEIVGMLFASSFSKLSRIGVSSSPGAQGNLRLAAPGLANGLAALDLANGLAEAALDVTLDLANGLAEAALDVAKGAESASDVADGSACGSAEAAIDKVTSSAETALVKTAPAFKRLAKGSISVLSPSSIG